MSVAAPNGAVPESLGCEATAAGAHEARDGQILLCLPDLGRILVEPDRIVSEAEPGADTAALLWLADRHAPLAQALLRKRFSLWAAGVVMDGRAVAIAGQDSVGKSTVAAELGRRGHRVLSDWRLPVDTGARSPVAYGTGGHLELWPPAAASLDLAPDQGLPVRPGLSKRAYPFTAAAAAPLAAVVILERELVSEPELEPLRGGSALEALSPVTSMARLVEAAGASRAHFAWLAAIAGACDIFCLKIDRFGPEVQAVANAVLSALS